MNAAQPECDRLSEKFSRSYKVLIQLYPLHWNEILVRIEQALGDGLTAAAALKAVNICRGLPEEARKALVTELVRDRREIHRGQQNFHTPLTAVTLEQLRRGDDVGFFSFVPKLRQRPNRVKARRITIASTGLSFVSHHTRADGRLANALVAGLERNGRKCWVAPRDTKRGRWNPQVLRAVHTCETFIALLSHEALKSPRVVGEIQIAVARGKPIIPIRLSSDIVPAEFDVGLQPEHHVDWFERDSRRVDQLVQHVCETFGSARAKEISFAAS